MKIADTIKDEIKTQVEAAVFPILKKHKCTLYGDVVSGEVYNVIFKGAGRVEVIFNDESMGLILAGHVAGSVYKEFEAAFQDIGLDMIDSDGCRGVFEVFETERKPCPNPKPKPVVVRQKTNSNGEKYLEKA